ncbi:hypothetical protein G4V62_02830 [Bacillaceae bacterium SIJ1]|nr:hypothetical protein [Litoribacterium kuwaitense]NGP43935.1 hypothetical protein [Litoribacterium kuwaitense]
MEASNQKLFLLKKELYQFIERSENRAKDYPLSESIYELKQLINHILHST